MVSGICIFIRSVIHLRHAAWNRVCRLKHSARCWDTLRSRSPWIGTCICPWVLNKARSPSSSSRIRNRKPVKISVRQSGKCRKIGKIWRDCLRKEESKTTVQWSYRYYDRIFKILYDVLKRACKNGSRLESGTVSPCCKDNERCYMPLSILIWQGTSSRLRGPESRRRSQKKLFSIRIIRRPKRIGRVNGQEMLSSVVSCGIRKITLVRK